MQEHKCWISRIAREEGKCNGRLPRLSLVNPRGWLVRLSFPLVLGPHDRRTIAVRIVSNQVHSRPSNAYVLSIGDHSLVATGP
jgi:hypothetical protein